MALIADELFIALRYIGTKKFVADEKPEFYENRPYPVDISKAKRFYSSGEVVNHYMPAEERETVEMVHVQVIYKEV